jgi:hypothetical protein
MGAWGLGIFENDDALDWRIELLREDDLGPVLSAFSKIKQSDDLELPECCYALAAAEVVAALKGNPSDTLPKDVIAWITSHPSLFIAEALIKDAEIAIEKIRSDSELQGLVEETGELNEWYMVLDDLLFRLK